jgi:hypothetical protein
MIIPCVFLLLSIIPCFWVISRAGSLAALYGAETVMTIFAAIASVPVIVTITETLPPHIRSARWPRSTRLRFRSRRVDAVRVEAPDRPDGIRWHRRSTGQLRRWWAVAMILVKESAPIRRGGPQTTASYRVPSTPPAT